MTEEPIKTVAEPPQTVAVDLALRIGEGQLKARVEVPADQTNITQLLPILQSFESAIIDATARQANAAGYAISCKAGCGACCRQMVPVSIFEAQALSQWIRTLPPERQRALEARFHQTLLALRDTGIIQRLVEEDWFADSDAAREMAIDYFHLGIPCPFLEDESCSIHPHRPLSCREYLVTSSPALCADPAKNSVRAVPLPLKISRSLYRMGAELEQDRRGWIPLVFLFAWEKSGADPGAAFAGTGQEVFHQFLTHLATSSTNQEAGRQPG